MVTDVGSRERSLPRFVAENSKERVTGAAFARIWIEIVSEKSHGGGRRGETGKEDLNVWFDWMAG